MDAASMDRSGSLRQALSSDLAILLALALARVVLHLVTGGQYGWHRDELATLDDARHLDWGYVAYPPFTPFVARIGLELFGPSLVGVRFFAALSQAAAMVLAGLMARELGGGRAAQVVAAVAAGISIASLSFGSMLMYVSFDFFWWVLAAYFLIRLLKSQDPRWWLAVGAAIGLGMMNKYTMAFGAAAIVGGVLLTDAHRYLASRWLWGGVGLSLLIFLPNLVWQIQHSFVSLEFLANIHARDVRIGRTEAYLPEQLLIPNPFTLPLWIAGFYLYLFSAAGRRYRLLGWMFVLSFLLFLLAQGRSYYLAPAYPMLLAAGAVAWERWITSLSTGRARLAQGATWGGLALGTVVGVALTLPVAPINSDLWKVTSEVHENFVEQVGWPELVDTVATLYEGLPSGERARAGIVTGNYGEAGAIDLYGPTRGLPPAISGINSYWARGYGDPPPQTVILLGYNREYADLFFEGCTLAAPVTNRYGVENEETRDYPGIFVCRGPRQPWPEMWPRMRHFG